MHSPGGSTMSSSGTLKMNLSYHGRTMTETIYVLWPAMITPQQASMCGAWHSRAHWYTGQDIHTWLQRWIPKALLWPGNDQHFIQDHSTWGCSSSLHPCTMEDCPPINTKGQDRAGERCSGIVVVLKPDGSVYICVDLTHLNKALQREVHLVLKLAKLGQSKNFS